MLQHKISLLIVVYSAARCLHPSLVIGVCKRAKSRSHDYVVGFGLHKIEAVNGSTAWSTLVH
jgi:hypothetical protein